MFSIVVISVYLLIRLNFGDEKVIVKDVAAFSLFAILNYDVHWLFLNS